MDDSTLKKVIIRFLKEHNIYFFITGEINREYKNNFDKFIERLKIVGVDGFYNRRDILSFAWEGNTFDFDEREKNVAFWKSIHNEWIRLFKSFERE